MSSLRFLRRPETVYRIVSFVLALAAVLILSTIRFGDPENGSSGEPELLVSFLDVGEGNCTVIRTPERHFIVVDTGPLSEQEYVLSALREQGCQTVDLLVLSHFHEDHAANAQRIIEQFGVKHVWLNNADPDTAFRPAIMEALAKQQIKPSVWQEGFSFQTDGVSIQMYADGRRIYSNENENSLVCMVKYGHHRILLTGDMTTSQEKEMMDNGLPLSCDILIVAHHGANTSSCEDFLQAAHPKTAILSVGRNNTYGHPDISVLQRLSVLGCRILRTDLNGTIYAHSDGTTLRLDWEKEPEGL